MSFIKKIQEFKEGRRQKKLSSFLKLVKNGKAIREDRLAALDYFCQHDDPEVAIPALLARFEYSLEHGINDTREKEMALKGICRWGEQAVPFIQRHLTSTSRIAWPIKALVALAGEETVTDVLKSCLDFGNVDLEQSKVDKNYDILCYLREYQLGPFGEKVVAFLQAHDERVRFAAVETLLAQDQPFVSQALEPFLVDQSGENTRLHQAVMQAFIRNKWPLSDVQKFLDSPASYGLTVNASKQIEMRS